MKPTDALDQLDAPQLRTLAASLMQELAGKDQQLHYTQTCVEQLRQ